MCTGVGSEGGGTRGAAAPLNAGCKGLRPPTNLRQWVSETRCEIQLPAVIHSGMAQKSFFAPAPRQTATVVQGKLALPGSCMPRLHDTWRRNLCRTNTCTLARRVWHFSAFHYQINYIIIITMFVPFTLFHVDRHLKRLDNRSQYSVEQIGSDCTRIDLRA